MPGVMGTLYMLTSLILTSPLGRNCCHPTPHFIDKETKTERDQVTCSVSHSQEEAELGGYTKRWRPLSCSALQNSVLCSSVGGGHYLKGQ